MKNDDAPAGLDPRQLEVIRDIMARPPWWRRVWRWLDRATIGGWRR